jgi:hypothetical protein
VAEVAVDNKQPDLGVQREKDTEVSVTSFCIYAIVIRKCVWISRDLFSREKSGSSMLTLE